MSTLIQHRPVTAKQREQFLEALRKGHSVTKSAGMAGRSRQQFYEARKGDPEFALAWADAVEAGVDVLEDEARRRAVEGDEWQVFDKDGNVLRTERRYSDKLLELLLKGRRPAIYRENTRIEVVGDGGGAVQVEARKVVSLGDVVDLVRQLGHEAEFGLDPGPAQRALPGARDVLPAPPLDQ